jgi:hypothetical protein
VELLNTKFPGTYRCVALTQDEREFIGDFLTCTLGNAGRDLSQSVEYLFVADALCTFGDILVERAIAEMNSLMAQRGCESIERASLIAPDEPIYVYRLGRSLDAAGAKRQAATYYQQFLKKSLSHVGALGRSPLDRDDFDDALIQAKIRLEALIENDFCQEIEADPLSMLAEEGQGLELSAPKIAEMPEDPRLPNIAAAPDPELMEMIAEISRDFLIEGHEDFDQLAQEFEEALGPELFDQFINFLPGIFAAEEAKLEEGYQSKPRGAECRAGWINIAELERMNEEWDAMSADERNQTVTRVAAAIEQEIKETEEIERKSRGLLHSISTLHAGRGY